MARTNGKRAPRFHHRLQQLCTAAGIQNPTQLATAMARDIGDNRAPSEGISVSGPARWWNGEGGPTVENLQAILRVTGGNGHWLLTGDGQMFATEPAAKDRALAKIMDAVDALRNSAAAAARQRVRQR